MTTIEWWVGKGMEKEIKEIFTEKSSVAAYKA